MVRAGAAPRECSVNAAKNFPFTKRRERPVPGKHNLEEAEASKSKHPLRIQSFKVRS